MPSMLILGQKWAKIGYFVHANSFLAKLGTVRVDRHLEISNLHEALPCLEGQNEHARHCPPDQLA